MLSALLGPLPPEERTVARPRGCATCRGHRLISEQMPTQERKSWPRSVLRYAAIRRPKNEAKSILAPGHVHAVRVTELLEAVRSEASRVRWPQGLTTALGLEVILQCPEPPPSDATNYLGGIGDVLESKSRRGDLSHLGDLYATALYENDRMFHEVHYRWMAGIEICCHVRIWTL